MTSWPWVASVPGVGDIGAPASGRVRNGRNASIGTVTLTAASVSEKTIETSSGTTTSLKLSMAVCTIAGAQMVFRPASKRWASGREVRAATSMATRPTTSPDRRTTGRWVNAIKGMVATTAPAKVRRARSRRNAYPRHTSSSASPWKAKTPISNHGHPETSVKDAPVTTVTTG
jgi:hypothetical protein